jgi:putative hydrolase
MYNLHCHSLLSDGQLLPSEVAMRYLAAGYKAIAITDHADYSNIRQLIPSIVEFCRNWPKSIPITVLPGVELTHIPPEHFKPLTRYARAHGAKIIIGHGQTPVEPVIAGTNRAALESDIDILAHPGMISDDDVLLAKKKGIFLEITSRRGHKEGNSHVSKRAIELGASLIINHDSHAPEDIISPQEARSLARDAGLTDNQIDTIIANTELLIRKRQSSF